MIRIRRLAPIAVCLLLGSAAGCATPDPTAGPRGTPAASGTPATPATSPAPQPSAPPVTSDNGRRTLDVPPLGAIAAETAPPPPPNLPPAGAASSPLASSAPPTPENVQRTPSSGGFADLGVAPTGALPPPRVLPVPSR